MQITASSSKTEELPSQNYKPLCDRYLGRCISPFPLFGTRGFARNASGAWKSKDECISRPGSNLGNSSPAEFCRERTPWRSAGPGTPRSAFPTEQPPIATLTADELNHAHLSVISVSSVARSNREFRWWGSLRLDPPYSFIVNHRLYCTFPCMRILTSSARGPVIPPGLLPNCS